MERTLFRTFNDETRAKAIRLDEDNDELAPFLPPGLDILLVAIDVDGQVSRVVSQGACRLHWHSEYGRDRKDGLDFQRRLDVLLPNLGGAKLQFFQIYRCDEL